MHRFSRRFFAGLTALLLSVMWLPAAFVTQAGAAGLDAGFEIDGNKTVDNAANLDWTSAAVGTQPIENDDAGGDPTVYSSSSKESNDPSTWTIAGGAPPKDDMTNIYGYAKPNTADVFFAFDRGATSGTDSYYLELNKLQPTNTTTYAPVRSDNDLRFRLDDKGNGVIALASASKWVSGAWTSVSVNQAGFDYAISADESFLEFAFDLTTLLNLQPACPPLFGSLGFRNVTGETGENLKDFIKPLKLSAGSSCGQLKIVKHDGSGALLAGATFRITPDPRPVASPGAYLDVLDNGTYDSDPADGQITVDPVTPGNYTVTEQSAPSGYFVDSASPSVTVPSGAANSPVPVFVDGQGSITVHKKTAGSAALGHSSFQLLNHATQAVVDTVADSDGDGTLVFSDVAPGTYDLHESVTPQGYDTAANVTGVVVDQTHQNVSVDVHDAQHETSLTVHKTDVPGTTPIAGATFALWVESNGVTGLQTAASGQTDADTSVGFTCTTGSNGFCTANYTHATWPNQYYWKETGVPWPYTVPDSPNDVFAVQPITSANVTTTLFTVEVHDPMASLGTVASPSTTVNSPLALNPTATIGDQATISGIQQAATGTIDFYLYKTGQACNPNSPDAAKKVGSSVAVSGPGTYPAQPITTTVSTAGTYHWLAVLTIGNDKLPGSCTDTGEQVIVGKATPNLTTVASNTGTVDGTVHDVAHLRDFASSVNGETVHFALYTAAGCGGTAYWPTTASDGDVALDANGDATSPNVAVDG
ncbi:MAG: large repetitive protein, partial [Frankiaceae bacterium]|nr:large repetitive protein [Frankiaceae bacterium]